MTKAIREIVIYCDANGVNAVEAVREYMNEKDTRVTRHEAERLVEWARAILKGLVKP